MTETAAGDPFEGWEAWRPPFALHVLCRYERRVIDPETNVPEQQRIAAKCEQCGAEWYNVCSTGQPRRRLSKFAVVHLHRDAFGGKR